MKEKCAYTHPDGRRCRRWPTRDSSYCYHHIPEPEQVEPAEGEVIPPYGSLSEPEEAFALVREVIMAVRLGRMRPHVAFSIGYLLRTWRHLHAEVEDHIRVKKGEMTRLPTLYRF